MLLLWSSKLRITFREPAFPSTCCSTSICQKLFDGSRLCVFRLLQGSKCGCWAAPPPVSHPSAAAALSALPDLSQDAPLPQKQRLNASGEAHFGFRSIIRARDDSPLDSEANSNSRMFSFLVIIATELTPAAFLCLLPGCP